jgi:branched-chain amino acid transport system ATP-binding protein
MTPLLEARKITVTYGGVHANDAVDLSFEAGQIIGLIGANGAGKTTFIDAITGFEHPASGRVVFDGQDITRASSDTRARAGLVRTFQSLELFDDLSVTDNLLVACEKPSWRSLLRDVVRPSQSEQSRQQIAWALDLVGMSAVADRLPEDLSHGQRKLVALARSLAARPKLLLLDEPAAGLDADESAALGTIVAKIVEEGISVFLIDHDMGLVLSVCAEIYVLDFGKIIAHGTPAEIRRDPVVLGAYLGGEASAESAQIENSGKG